MIVVFKRSNLFILAMSVFLCAMTWNIVHTSQILPASALAVSDKSIVIDPGHGSSDGGAVGLSQTLEKDLNLKIALKLQKLLEQTGASVTVTRSDDEPIAKSKKEDMRLRKSYQKKDSADIFVSIHMNKFSQQKYSGAQVFYAPDEKSKILGEHIQNEMRNILNPQNNRTAKKAESSIFLLKNPQIPSVIVECGFLSNPEEERKLATEEYQEKVAWSIYSGVIKYFDGE